jgi:hypothetical protein
VELDQARAAYGEVRDNPQVANSAPVPLREAEEALLRAEQTWDQTKNVGETQNLAAVAKQRAEIVRVAATQKQAEAELEELAAARDQLLLDARTRQAQRAQQEADQAYQQVRSTTTQNQQLQQELNNVTAELAAREAMAKAPATRRTKTR